MTILSWMVGACSGRHLRGAEPADLAITHATVLDVRTGKASPESTILIKDGVITAVSTRREDAAPRAIRVLDARGRLTTPGLVDVHLHTHLIFKDSASSGPNVAADARPPLVMTRDSIAAYRQTLARAYLPYGVTLVRDVGTTERHLAMLTAWMQRSPDAPDIYPSGAYFVSAEPGRVPIAFGVAVADSAAAAAKVREYCALGLHNVKLYWRLQLPAFRGALHEANRLGMNVTAHIDQQVMTIGQALDLGLRNVEHIHTLALSVMGAEERDSVYRRAAEHLALTPRTAGGFYLLIPELWNHLGSDNPRITALIAQFKAHDASLTPTLHVFAQRLGLAPFASPPWNAGESTEAFTRAQRERAVLGYRIMASYVKRMYDAGIRLNVGTDAQHPGRAVLSEMLLLHDAGIPMAGVFRIATLNSAEDIGQGGQYGTVEPGKRADLVLFEGDPLTRPVDLLGPKLVVKDGVIWGRTP